MTVQSDSATPSPEELSTGKDVVSLETHEKEQQLRELFHQMKSVLVAYSGGVDSTYVAWVATQALGNKTLCVTAESPSVPEHQRSEAARVAAQFAFYHETIQTTEINNARYVANAPDRCYFCKSELYGRLVPLAAERGCAFIVDGSTTDDLGDHRPGRIAAGEDGVRSPLVEVGISKREVRELSRRAGLPTWNKPSSPCLSSRIAYGTTVTIERLAIVDRGEQILREMGFREFRVRHHDKLVRLEIAPAEMERVLSPKVIAELARRFRQLGFQYVTLDLHGYRTGAMNEILS